MSAPESGSGTAVLPEEQIAQWRSYLRRREAIHAVDVSELEDHLREQISVLMEQGLTGDEAFLVAVKRMGGLDTLSREFAREHSERLWKQLVLEPGPVDHPRSREGLIVMGLALLAAVLVKLPALFGLPIETEPSFYLRNVSFFVLPLLTGYFVWSRRREGHRGSVAPLVVAMVAGLAVANLPPYRVEGSSEGLVALHLPIALWLVVGVAYAGGRWNTSARRMDFIRFSGELFIYYTLIALGGGVLSAFVAMIFESIGLSAEAFIGSWLVPCGAAGAVLVASWLVEAKQSVIENMAPVLTRLFTPLFTLVLLTFLATLLGTGRGINIEREMLIAFDLLLVVVLALLLYSISARDPANPPALFDIIAVVLVLSALLVDLVALGAIANRIRDFGLTPNRIAALGMNLLLLINLSGSAVLQLRFLRGRGPFTAVERWQTGYLPVFAGWAALVVFVLPPLFGYR